MTAPVRRPEDLGSPHDDAPRMPERIGKYVIQRRLGAGGMAVVYAALQESPRRVVALKVMRPGIAASATSRRFRRESEILARLRHPHIAQIFDAGMWDDGAGGMPYFVMEYIPDAKPLDEFCDARKLDLRDRLRLFVKVCAGVQHGHAQGIVHRDLKPGNILVTPQGDPKIIDYGVARATETDLSGQTQQTEAGKLVGTVAYMSPEQVEARPGEIDPRTDVYALGVILFRLLTDRSPYAMSGVGLHEAVRIIREEAPTRPSIIRPELRGDVETILLTALEKERGRRYADAGAMGRDVLRFLAHKPIKARPAGPLYRGRLFLRRHRGMAVIASVVAGTLLLLGGGGAWMWMNWRDLDAQRRTIAEEAQAREQRDREVRTGAAASLAPQPERRPVSLRLGSHPILGLVADGAPARLVALDADGVVRVVSISERRTMLATPPLDGLSGPLLVMPAGDRALLGRSDGLVDSMLLADGWFERTPLDAGDSITALAVSGDGRLVASAARDLVVRLWPTAEGSARVLRGLDGLVTALALDATSRTLAAGSAAGQLLVVRDPIRTSASDAIRPARIGLTEEPIRHLAISDDGSTVVAATEDGRCWSLLLDSDGAPTKRWNAQVHRRPLTALVLHPSGRTLVTADNGGLVRFWSSTGTMLHEIEHRAPGADMGPRPTSVWSLSYAGPWLALGDDLGGVRLLPVAADGAPAPAVDSASSGQ